MPSLDADSQNRILLQQLLAELPDNCSRALRAIPEIKTTADAVARARLLMMVSHQASVPTVASVNVRKDSQTACYLYLLFISLYLLFISLYLLYTLSPIDGLLI